MTNPQEDQDLKELDQQVDQFLSTVTAVLDGRTRAEATELMMGAMMIKGPEDVAALAACLTIRLVYPQEDLSGLEQYFNM
jgi:hypothetical protein